MPNTIRIPAAPAIRFTLIAAAFLAAPIVSLAATTVTSIAPGNEDQCIRWMVKEDFEDTALLPGFSVTFSNWRNASNTLLASGPVTYTGTLPQVWNTASQSFPLNAWDGVSALVNGHGHDWAFPFACTIELTFSPPLPSVGIGLSNVQTDAGSANTPHALTVNGIAKGNLEALPGWVTTVFGKNRYLLFRGEPSDPIASVRIHAVTHFDGMVLDKLAMGDSDCPTPARSSSWGRVKQLYR